MNFNLEYYSATTSEIFQKELKEKSKIIKVDNVSKQDCYIKMGFYSLDYGDIDKLLFTKSITESEERRLQEFLNKNKDLSKLDDSELRKAFNLCSKKTDWERFFESKKIDNNFQQTLNDIRIFRNNIAHCKFISTDQYKKCREILKKTIKSLDVAIRITENKDYISKNIKLHQESFEKIAKMIQETLLSVHKNIDTISQSIVNVSDRLNEIVKPINPFVSNIPNIVLPEIELPKFNIPNYFNLTNNKELTKNVESNEKIE